MTTINRSALRDNGADRSRLVHKIDEMVSDIAIKIFDQIKARAIYKNFSAMIGSDKVPFYFMGRLKEEIRPYITKTVINRSGAYIPKRHIFGLARNFLELSGVSINNHSGLSKLSELCRLLTRKFLDRNKFRAAIIWNRLWCDRKIEGLKGSSPMIGVHISEGIDTRKRSDIHWFLKSQIDPGRILLFINENSLEKKYGFFVSPNKRLLKELEASPFKWVIVPQKRLTISHKGIWSPKKINIPQWANLLLNEKASDEIDRWISDNFEELLYEIEFWKSFLKEFNVKLLYFPGEGSTTFIAQGIAFDSFGEDGGLTIGKQRSDIGHSLKRLTTYHTKDIVFTWNNRNPEYFNPPYNIVRSQIVAGHPNGANMFQPVKEIDDIKRQFDKRGVAFAIAFFDTAHGKNIYNFLSSEVESVYAHFLKWILEDNTVGLIIKSKKQDSCEKLTGIYSLLKSAEATGRCIRLPISYLPSFVSRVAEIVVGLGVSSAATEAVIAGCRGIHYHSNFPKYHEYYRWGYEKLVFDDLNRMLDALKSYKADKSSNPKLGDWTPYLDLLDPFRDGKAGERMGTYFKWCLEGFDIGLNRDDVIDQASSKYAQAWGNNKIIKSKIKI